MRNEIKFLLLLGVISGLLGYALYITCDAFLALADDPLPVIKLEPKHETTEEIIARVAKEQGLNPTITLMIADMGSKLNRYAIHINKDGTYDRGVFMYNSYHYRHIPDECAFDPECATKEFATEVKKGRLKNWVEVRGFRLEVLEKYLIEER